MPVPPNPELPGDHYSPTTCLLIPASFTYALWDSETQDGHLGQETVHSPFTPPSAAFETQSHLILTQTLRGGSYNLILQMQKQRPQEENPCMLQAVL